MLCLKTQDGLFFFGLVWYMWIGWLYPKSPLGPKPQILGLTKKFAGEKHSSLFVRDVIDAKKLYKIDNNLYVC